MLHATVCAFKDAQTPVCPDKRETVAPKEEEGRRPRKQTHARENALA